MTPLYNHGDIVEIKGKHIIGSIRTRTYGWTPKRIQPEYGVLPQGEMSLISLIHVKECELKKI